MAEKSTYVVSGMTCQNCVAHVKSSLIEIEGVGEVTVDLVAGGDSSVTVSSAQPLDRRVVRSAVAGAGYRLAG